MGLDRAIIDKELREISQSYRSLKNIELGDFQEFAYGGSSRSAALILNGATRKLFGLGRRILNEAGYAGPIDGDRSIAIGLLEIGLASPDLERKLGGIAGGTYDDEALYLILKNRIEFFCSVTEEFANAVKTYLGSKEA